MENGSGTLLDIEWTPSKISQFDHSDGGGGNHLIDLSKHINQFGIPASSLIKQFDHNHDGELQLDEFHDMCAWVSRYQMDRSAVETMFHILDSNENG